MKTEAQKRLEEIIKRLNDPEDIVMEKKELTEKLGKIVSLMNNPEETVMEKKELTRKMEKIVSLVNKTMIDPEVDIEYCIPEVETTAGTCNVSGSPYISVTYAGNETSPTRKISLGKTALQSTLDDLAKHVILSVEQFKDETDTIEMG